MRQPIVERFAITGRGTVVVVPEPTNLPVGKPLHATIYSMDGAHFTAVAFKESLLRKTAPPIEQEAYLLKEVSKDAVPDDATIEIALLQAVSGDDVASRGRA